jgi:hypothetical protein
VAKIATTASGVSVTGAVTVATNGIIYNSKTVIEGANDSGGSGFRALIVPNT